MTSAALGVRKRCFISWGDRLWDFFFFFLLVFSLASQRHKGKGLPARLSLNLLILRSTLTTWEMTHFRCIVAFHRAIVTEHLGVEEWNIGGIKVGRKWILWRGPMFPSLLESVAPIFYDIVSHTVGWDWFAVRKWVSTGWKNHWLCSLFEPKAE